MCTILERIRTTGSTIGMTVPHLNLAPSSLVVKLIGAAELLGERKTFCELCATRDGVHPEI